MTRPALLLLGGTSETAPLAQALQDQGWAVRVSTATDAELALPAGVQRRMGRLDAAGLADLCRREGCRALVDAAHPFATALQEEARRAAALAGLPCLRFRRPQDPLPDQAHVMATHDAAARLAFAFRGPVALATGSRTLAPYVAEARRTGLPLTARVLDHPESLEACRAAGLESWEVVTGRGPFSLQENVLLLASTGAAALVTKDSGEAGGLSAKAEACRRTGAHLVVVQRQDGEGLDLPGLLAATQPLLHPSNP